MCQEGYREVFFSKKEDTENCFLVAFFIIGVVLGRFINDPLSKLYAFMVFLLLVVVMFQYDTLKALRKRQEKQN